MKIKILAEHLDDIVVGTVIFRYPLSGDAVNEFDENDVLQISEDTVSFANATEFEFRPIPSSSDITIVEVNPRRRKDSLINGYWWLEV